MALSILDGNQSATTLSTILSSGQHITAHTVVSLGTQAITDMRGAVSGSVVSISNFPSTQTIAGTVTANIGNAGRYDNGGDSLRMDLMAVRGQDAALFLREGGGNVPISGTVTIGAGTAQIGSVTASISNSLTIGSIPVISGTVTVGAFSSVSVGSSALLAGGLRSASVEPLRLDVGTGYLQVKVESAPSISGTVTLGAGTAQIGSVTASISNSVVTFYPMQGTTVSNTNFTSLTSSTTIAPAVTMRESLTVFNEGAGNLHISPGATCTTISYQVRLSSGDYWECPQGQLSIAHTAVFATAGTARVTQVS